MAKKPKSGDGNGPRQPGEAPPQATVTGGPGAQGEDGAPQLSVLAQFVRDLSFESPNAPGSLQSLGADPKLDMNVNVGATKRAEDVFEVALNFEARAASAEGVIYNIELVYAGLFRVANIPPNALQGVLFVDCPAMLFPFLRRLVAEVSQEGGFPPLMLSPIDFAALYRQNAQRAQGQPAAPVKN